MPNSILAIFSTLIQQIDTLHPCNFVTEFKRHLEEYVDDPENMTKSDALANVCSVMYCTDPTLYDDELVMCHLIAFISKQFPEPEKDASGWPIMTEHTLYSAYPLTQLYSGDDRAAEYLFNYQATYAREGLEIPEANAEVRRVFKQMQSWGMIPVSATFTD